jgi:formate hydrogenlyase transcriptional activator
MKSEPDSLSSPCERRREEQSFLWELAQFRALLDQSNDSIEVVEPGTLRFLDVNGKACSELGYSREELLSMTVFDVAPNLSREAASRSLQRLRESGFVLLEGLHRRKDGSTFPVEVNFKIVQLDKEYVVAVSRNITDRKRAAALLEESEKRFRAVYQGAPVGIAVVDPHTGAFLQVNAKYCEIAGRTNEEMLRLRFQDITHAEDVDASNHLTAQLIEGKIRDYKVEKRYCRPDGQTVWIHLSVVPLWAAGEDACWHIAIAQDITERKIAEEALRASEERVQLFIEHAPAALAMFDREMRYLFVSRRWRTDYALGEEDLRGRSHYELFPELPEQWKEAHRRGLAGEVLREERQKFERANSAVKWVKWEIRPWHDKQGLVGGIVIFAEDVTQRTEMEEDLRQAKERLSEEKLYLQQEIDTELGFEDIIGKSNALKSVMEWAGTVATCDASVLLLGETGTGKELVARAIHRLSNRAGNSFIKMNCAAIPSGLLESELFGHEKGAFTGAVSRKIGRLELADKGTIFLDEVGEISLALQPKLLRVLQDQEFERLGGIQTIKVNFRLIAATNRDLGESVRENEFRSDLYYRLNVFPIKLPPLRERRDDIPLLVEHFLQKCARRMNKVITSIPTKTMDELAQAAWPGNVRELENFMERSVILTQGSVLCAPLGELRSPVREEVPDDTLKSQEREHILQALRESRGLISGPRGAAMRLGLKRTTLQSKLKNLGINPRTLSARET